jgi:hypothetical protein
MFEAHSIAEWFSRSLDRANGNPTPYSHWLLEQTLPEEAARSIATLPFAAPIIGDTMGKRETHNSTRNFFSAQNRHAYEVCETLSSGACKTRQAPRSPAIFCALNIARISTVSGLNLTQTSVQSCLRCWSIYPTKRIARDGVRTSTTVPSSMSAPRRADLTKV